MNDDQMFVETVDAFTLMGEEDRDGKLWINDKQADGWPETLTVLGRRFKLIESRDNDGFPGAVFATYEPIQ